MVLSYLLGIIQYNPDLIPISSLIVHHNDQFFRFQKKGSKWICEVCYWRGEVEKTPSTSRESTQKDVQPSPLSAEFQATVTQQFAPFESFQAWFDNQNEGLAWVAAQLVKNPENPQS